MIKIKQYYNWYNYATKKTKLENFSVNTSEIIGPYKTALFHDSTLPALKSTVLS
jgi:hypothetical protein